MLFAVIATFPAWGAVKLGDLVGGGTGLFSTFSELLSLVPGHSGVFLRRGFYLMTLERCARDVCISFGTLVCHRQVRIGSQVYIGGRCTIGTCDIGDFALIGSNVDILSGNRQHSSSDPSLPRSVQKGTFQTIRIGRNTWLGNSTVIMADVGDDSIIGAGSVVVKPIPSHSVAVGNPAVVKHNIKSGVRTPHRTRLNI